MNVPGPPANAVAAASHPGPYPYYARLVAEAPFEYDHDLDAWIAADAEHVEAVLQHPALWRDQDLLERLRRHPDELRSSIEQTIRDDSPVQNTRRYLVEEVRINGTQVREGDCYRYVAGYRDRVHACAGWLA